MKEEPRQFRASAEDSGRRLDQFLVSQIPDISRARAQQLIEQAKVLINGSPVKASHKMKCEELVTLTGSVQAPPLRAFAEDIPLEVVYEDKDLAVINKPAGMMVHAGAGVTEDLRNRGTLVNALLHRFGGLSGVSGELRPGIVHRLDRNTSGLIIVAKNDASHRKLAAQFARREVQKTYVALVHGWLKEPKGTISAAITRDVVRRTRMTVKGRGGRPAVSHYTVIRKIESAHGKFALVEVKIETGRTHQIRVHLSSIGHPVVGDHLYGASAEIRPAKGGTAVALHRQFLHAAKLEFVQPKSGKSLRFQAELPQDLAEFLAKIEGREHLPKRKWKNTTADGL